MDSICIELDPGNFFLHIWSSKKEYGKKFQLMPIGSHYLITALTARTIFRYIFSTRNIIAVYSI